MQDILWSANFVQSTENYEYSIQDSQETNSFDSYNVHFKSKIACKQSNFEKKIIAIQHDVQQRLKDKNTRC